MGGWEGCLEPGLKKANSNRASIGLSWKVTLPMVTSAPDIDMTASARTPSVVNFYGQDKTTISDSSQGPLIKFQ